MNAYNDLMEFLKPDETVEAIVFGNWGWSYEDEPAIGGYGEPEPAPVPLEARKKVLTLEQARPYMEGWSFNGGYGAPECYAVTIWTNQRVVWVTQYDGSTGLDAAPRYPIAHMPDMPGG